MSVYSSVHICGDLDRCRAEARRNHYGIFFLTMVMDDTTVTFSGGDAEILLRLLDRAWEAVDALSPAEVSA